MLYKFADERGIPYRKTQKLIVATNPSQHDYLHTMYKHASSIPPPSGPVPVEMLTGDQARSLEPDLGTDVSLALLSTETGIIDAHGLCEVLENDVIDSGSGEIVYGTTVVRVDRAEPSTGGQRGGDGSDEGYVVQTITDGQPSAILARCIINAAGLSAHHIINQILPDDAVRPLFYAKGSYFQYRGPGVKHVQRLLYPCPEEGLGGLGTHLTMDLAGDIRFGPDVEWLTPPEDPEAEESIDYWENCLAPSEANFDKAIAAVKRYLPGLVDSGFSLDYAGIRPKLSRTGFADFDIQLAAPGFVNLMGIESPGLTSSLAIAEMVEGIVKRQVHGIGRGTGRTVSETGSRNLDAWA